MELEHYLLVAALIVLASAARLAWVLPSRFWRRSRGRSSVAAPVTPLPPASAHTDSRATLLVVLGSGGHTAEMLALLQGFRSPCVSAVHFVVAATDNHSEEKARRWTAAVASAAPATATGPSGARQSQPRVLTTHFHRVTRSREVGQGWVSSACTTVMALAECLWLVLRVRPTLVVVNGPGTCLPLVYAAFLCKFVGILGGVRLVFVESFARVQALSLTGQLVWPVVDRFVVQWERLHMAGTEYLGHIF